MPVVSRLLEIPPKPFVCPAHCISLGGDHTVSLQPPPANGLCFRKGILVAVCVCVLLCFWVELCRDVRKEGVRNPKFSDISASQKIAAWSEISENRTKKHSTPLKQPCFHSLLHLRPTIDHKDRIYLQLRHRIHRWPFKQSEQNQSLTRCNIRSSISNLSHGESSSKVNTKQKQVTVPQTVF